MNQFGNLSDDSNRTFETTLVVNINLGGWTSSYPFNIVYCLFNKISNPIAKWKTKK